MNKPLRALSCLLALMLVLPCLAAADQTAVLSTEEMTIVGARYAYVGEGDKVAVYDTEEDTDNVYTADTAAQAFICETDDDAWFLSGNTLLRVAKANSEEPLAVAQDVSADCLYERVSGCIYYLSSENAQLLRKYDPATNAVSDVADLPAGMTAELVQGAKGLYMWMTKGSGSKKLYRLTLEDLKLHAISLPAEGEYVAFECAEVVYGDALMVRNDGEEMFYRVTTGNVIAADEYNGDLYYVTQDEKGVFILEKWSTLTSTRTVLSTGVLEGTLIGTMAVLESRACVIDEDATIYSISLADGTILAKSLGQTMKADARLVKVGDRVAVYGSAEDKNGSGFICLTAVVKVTGDEDDFAAYEPGAVPTTTPVPTTEPTVQPTTKPTTKPTSEPSGYTTLKKGDRGSEVKKLQARLNELGYKCGKADGIFGNNTKLMVRMFQGDVGLEETGVATPETQKKLYSSSAPTYNAYKTLRKGASGARVEKLQKRLRELGYSCEAVDGKYGKRTMAAVKIFQKRYGLTEDGIAGPKTLKALYGKSAAYYDYYIELRKGDTGEKVKHLEERLVEWGYLSKAGDTYDKATVSAVKAFQKDQGFEVDGVASIQVQKMLDGVVGSIDVF